MKVGRMLVLAGIGWLAGALLIIILSLVISPMIVGGSHSLQDPVDRIVLGMVLLGITPFTLLGGLLGGRMSREGGERSQVIMAALAGLALAIPFGCFGLWLLGW
jgi:hypothetical protein